MLGRVELKNETSDNYHQKNNIEQKCRNVGKSQKVYAKGSETIVIKKNQFKWNPDSSFIELGS